MNDVTRTSVDEEIARLCKKAKDFSPDSEEYGKLSDKLVKLVELANKDDEARNRYEIDKEKLDAEASLDGFRRGAESERLEIEQEFKMKQLEMEEEFKNKQLEYEQVQNDKERKRAIWQTVATCGVTLLTFIGTWVANSISQSRSEQFEESGHAYTSRFARWQVKEPVHPSMLKK